ncbi:hypothetical protein RhiirA5_426429 [Rhizophagus irregularis]|uniref:Uncharacterized protein n=1 Tax=Rhizophagus irregularis TaxID=588596 RepID=A0A2I1F2K2_9GLOM|nr:hypothetical protein RhiirA5_426429 [Rhizophagus irregularis]PKY28598.1 hypothetical protein RhiirB3_444844 [Rhizophagus irregularis]
MNSNNQTTQKYSDLSMYQTENSSAPLHNNNNDSINNIGIINLSRIPDHQLPQQFIETTIQPTSQIYPDNNNAYNATSNSVNGTISDNI